MMLENLENSRTRSNCARIMCGRGCMDIFALVYHFSLLSTSVC